MWYWLVLTLSPLQYTLYVHYICLKTQMMANELLRVIYILSNRVHSHAPSIRAHMVFFQISSQWESQKNRFAFVSFGKIQFLPPCLWDLTFISYRLSHLHDNTHRKRDWRARGGGAGIIWWSRSDVHLRARVIFTFKRRRQTVPGLLCAQVFAPNSPLQHGDAEQHLTISLKT